MGKPFALAAPGHAEDVFRVALLHKRHRECLRILVVIACLASFRRGRTAMSMAIRKAASPLSFLLWCVGLKRWIRWNSCNLLLWGEKNSDHSPPPLIQRGRWSDVFRRSTRGETSETSKAAVGGLLDQQGGSGPQLRRSATLGERGMQSAFAQFWQLLKDGACCDVTLIVDGKAFKAHKCVLAAQSSPLRAMFEGSFKEGSENVIALLDVEPSSFSLLLDFLYGRSIDINDENTEALLDLSARYGVSLLRRYCCEFMASSANPGNVCSLLAVADRYDCHGLRKQLLTYTLECFRLVCCDGNSQGFCGLSLALVTEVLKDDRLVPGEEGEVAVFWAAISWLEAERSRRRSADEVLSHVRFGLVSAKTLAETVERNPFMQSKVAKTFVHEAYRLQALPPGSRDEFASSMSARAQPRTAMNTADAVSLLSPPTVAAAAGDRGGGGDRESDRLGRFSSAFLEPSRGSSEFGFAQRSRAIRYDHEKEESHGDGRECQQGGQDVKLEGKRGGRRESAEGESKSDDKGVGDRSYGVLEDGVPASPGSGGAEEMSRRETTWGQGTGGEVDASTRDISTRKSNGVEASRSKRLWGIEHRMYV